MLPNEKINGVAEETMGISSFNQSVLKISYRIFSNEIVVYWLKAFNDSLGYYENLRW